MLSKKKLIPLALAGALAWGSANAALTLSQATVAGENQFSDDNAELVLKYDSTLNEGAGGYRAFNPLADLIEVNDILVGIVGITSFPTGSAGTSAALYNEITAVYALQALTADPLPANSCLNPALTTCTSYTFGAPILAGADPLNDALGWANSIYSTNFTSIAGFTTGLSFAAMFEDSAPNFDRDTTLLNGSETATDGILRLVFDLDLANGDFFFGNGPADVTQFALLLPGGSAGSIGGQGTVSYQNVPGWVFGPSLQVIGNIYRPVAGDWPIHSDSTYTLNAQPVPEPGTLALLGLGLAGLGLGRRFVVKKSPGA